MRASGFDVGATVAAKKHPSLGSTVCETRVATSLHIFKIVQIVAEDQGEYVSLDKLPAGSAAPPALVKVDEVLELWARADLKDLVEAHPGWLGARSSRTLQGKSLRAKGSIFAALGCLAELLDEVTDLDAKVEVHIKPTRRVVAIGNQTAAALHVIPETTDVKATSEADIATTNPEELASMVEVTLDPVCEGFRLFLVGPTGSENMASA